MGHLPGTVEAKADPFMGPVLDALDYFLTPERALAYLKNGTIKVVPLEIMRGANMHNTFVILDEMQNCSYMQLKMFVTRLGENSKCIISGDLKQSDLDKHNFSNSSIIQDRFIDSLKGGESIGYCELGINDIVRSGISKTCIMRLS
jgi:phosphate starvation-inducible PhoH-like protein